jgi:hypothetical protein
MHAHGSAGVDYFLAGMIALVMLALGVGVVRWWRQEPRLRRHELRDATDDDRLQTLLEVATHHRGQDIGSGHDSGFGLDTSNDGGDGGSDSGGGDAGGGGD